MHHNGRGLVELITFVNGRALIAQVWLSLTSDVQPTQLLSVDGTKWIVRRILEPGRCSSMHHMVLTPRDDRALLRKLDVVA